MDALKHYRESYKGLALQYLRQDDGRYDWHAERVEPDGVTRIVLYGKELNLGRARTRARTDVDQWITHGRSRA